MQRRHFITGASALALSGCAGLTSQQINHLAAQCRRFPDATQNQILRIDAHCHLMNAGDGSAGDFLARHQFKTPNFRIIPGLMARLGVSDAANPEVDTRLLQQAFDEGWSDEKLCSIASGREKGPFIAKHYQNERVAFGEGRYFGFISSRVRNATIMMAHWPQVDIFTPSMVDLYEGFEPVNKANDGYGGIAEQARFYRQLNLTTRGRFLPLVSFNPEREVKECQKQGLLLAKDGPLNETYDRQIDLVRDAIENHGFIGVKVYPPAGFDPHDNTRFGIANLTYRPNAELSAAQAQRYDQAMGELYALCTELDVPVLTHGSASLSANAEKMFQDASASNWTNAPGHWVSALAGQITCTEGDFRGGECGTRPKSPLCGQPRDFDVCLAHFANRFAKSVPGQDSEMTPQYAPDGTLIPSLWLHEAMDEILTGSTGRLWLDLSFMSLLAISKADQLGVPIPDKLKDQRDGGRYARAFEAFLSKRSHRKLLDRILYGSDWHMPGISVLGPDYLNMIEATLPSKSARKRIMGQNAARFYKLRQGEANRERLARFYRDNGLELGQILWMDRIDRAS